jgi:transposase-like protein
MVWSGNVGDHLFGRKGSQDRDIRWRVDETYIKVKGRWMYLYWVVDSAGNTLEFLLSNTRDTVLSRDSKSGQLWTG